MIEDLIFDVGANNGDDTAHYLTQGYRVVAVEANPALAEACRARFASEIATGRVTVEEIGIWPIEGRRAFYVNESNDEHSSFSAGPGQRAGAWHRIEVDCVPFGHLTKKYGVPYYLKVDIETADQWCLRDLDPEDKPTYVSVEGHRAWYLALLFALGYNAFKCVDQSSHNRPFVDDQETVLGRLRSWSRRYESRARRTLCGARPGTYPSGSSGPFGEATPGAWVDFEHASYDFLHFRFGYRGRGTLNPRGWYDFHATYKPEFDRF